MTRFSTVYLPALIDFETMRGPFGGRCGGPGGPLAMPGSEPRQARKGATVTADACAGVWLSGPLPS